MVNVKNPKSVKIKDKKVIETVNNPVTINSALTNPLNKENRAPTTILVIATIRIPIDSRYIQNLR